MKREDAFLLYRARLTANRRDGINRFLDSPDSWIHANRPLTPSELLYATRAIAAPGFDADMRDLPTFYANQARISPLCVVAEVDDGFAVIPMPLHAEQA